MPSNADFVTQARPRVSWPDGRRQGRRTDCQDVRPTWSEGGGRPARRSLAHFGAARPSGGSPVRFRPVLGGLDR